MNTSIILNPKFEYLRAFITDIPQKFSSSGEVLYKGRNEIRVFEKENIILNIKEFRIPLLPNRFIYRLFRPTKAQRAYEYAFKLKEAGFNTPTPIAYIIEHNKGMLGKCYFISEQLNYTRRFYEFGKAEIDAESEMILTEFGKYTALLHEHGIYHQDYSPGNILFDLKIGKPEFCLVDINRMNFGDVSMKKGCANFARLWGSPTMFKIIAKAYAKKRNFNETETSNEMLRTRRLYWQKAIRKRPAEFPLEF